MAQQEDDTSIRTCHTCVDAFVVHSFINLRSASTCDCRIKNPSIGQLWIFSIKGLPAVRLIIISSEMQGRSINV